ncbi:MAG TPA: beta-ketoacyl synthase N-terminal-like domain-containing protein [Trebonia sp.]|jgi:act minimal PKS chain-length factor (CLF/KS beta)|nr:beta-ketoacyl synthase N-terminal-like domain-containing protein [Trebonia sp.]
MTVPVVVTGLGVMSPNGLGHRDFWTATLAGKAAIGPVTRFDAAQYPATLAGEISGFSPEAHLPSRLLPQTDRVTRLSLVAADWALADAGIEPASQPEFGMGVITASSAGGFEFSQGELRNLWSKGSRHVSGYQSFAWFYAVNTGQISIRNGMKGPSGVVVSDQAGALDAVANARRQVRRGASLIVTGAVDATLCPWGWVGLHSSGRLSTATEPTRAYLPFDHRAGGYVAGEGGAILVLEPAASAAARGARAYGEIAGYAATFDGPGPGSPAALGKAIELALADAGLAPADVDVVFADGAADPELDRHEAAAITAAFGPRGVPVTAPKTMTGRLCAGMAALDLATAFLAMAEGVIPPTVNVEPDDSYGLDLVVGQPRAARLRAALVLARGQGGFNSAMVVRGHADGSLPPLTPSVTKGRPAMPITAASFSIDDLVRILCRASGTPDGVDLTGDILDTRFEALGYDSLALLEAASWIEREYGIELTDADYPTPRAFLAAVRTAGDAA